MGCENMVTCLRPKGLGYVEYELKCGSTNWYGDTALCDDRERCPNQHSDGRPWFICRHGNDVSEHLCGLCELEDL
jgi:hypothetical protein